MKMLCLLALGVLLSVESTGCGGRDSTPPQTQLTMVAVDSWVGRSVFHLDCSPVGGDIPRLAKACSLLAAEPTLVTRPQVFVCHGGTASWWQLTISGRLNGNPVYRSFSTCWTPQMATIGKLGLSWQVLRSHLVARRREAVLPGVPRVFPPGTLRAADIVTCDVRGHQLAVGVPIERSGQAASVGYGVGRVREIRLEVAHERDGSVRALCHRTAS